MPRHTSPSASAIHAAPSSRTSCNAPPPRSNPPPPLTHVAPIPIPDVALVNIEYPGILAESPSSSSSAGISLDQHPSKPSSLDRALSTLHASSPFPPIAPSPHAALRLLADIHNRGISTLECRLALEPMSSHGAQHSHPALDAAELYRSPLIGEAVDTGNLVIRITNRTWHRRTKRQRRTQQEQQAQRDGTDQGHPSAMDIDPALFDDPPQPPPPATTAPSSHANRYTGEVRHEYKVEILGVATKTVRFRSMADFAYKPDLGPPAVAAAPATAAAEASTATSNSPPLASHEAHSASASASASPPPLHASSSSVAASAAGVASNNYHDDPIIELHAALATMDLAKLRTFQFAEQHQDYTRTDPSTGTLLSNLRLLPPAYFSRPNIPFRYNFQQHGKAELKLVARPRHRPDVLRADQTLTTSQSDEKQIQRIVNTLRLFNIAPRGYRLGKNKTVPQRATEEVKAIEHRVSPDALARYRAILASRPIWSRVAFINQLEDKDRYEIQGTNGKVYFALTSYSMVGGPWRDTIVRFGYDVRKDKEARFYQRLFMRGKRDWGVTAAEAEGEGEGEGETRGGDEEEQQPQGETRRRNVNEQDDEQDDPANREDDDDQQRRRTVPSSSPSDNIILPPPTYHIFNGTTLSQSFGNFQLCDITDPISLPFIRRTEAFPLEEDDGIGTKRWIAWLRDECDEETGWYTREAWDCIRSIVAARFARVKEKGTELPEQEVEEVVRRWKERCRASDQDRETIAQQERGQEPEELSNLHPDLR